MKRKSIIVAVAALLMLTLVPATALASAYYSRGVCTAGVDQSAKACIRTYADKVYQCLPYLNSKEDRGSNDSYRDYFRSAESNTYGRQGTCPRENCFVDADNNGICDNYNNGYSDRPRGGQGCCGGYGR